MRLNGLRSELAYNASRQVAEAFPIPLSASNPPAIPLFQQAPKKAAVGRLVQSNELSKIETGVLSPKISPSGVASYRSKKDGIGPH